MAKSKQLPGQLNFFDLIDSITRQNKSTRRVKAVKVSHIIWELLKEQSIDMNTLPEIPKEYCNGYIGKFDSVEIVLDDDVLLYEVVYEGEER